MFNLDKFISDSVTFRPVSMFNSDIEANKEQLTQEIASASGEQIGVLLREAREISDKLKKLK